MNILFPDNVKAADLPAEMERMKQKGYKAILVVHNGEKRLAFVNGDPEAIARLQETKAKK